MQADTWGEVCVVVVVAGGIVCIFIWMTWTMACVALWIASYGEWHGGGGDGG